MEVSPSIGLSDWLISIYATLISWLVFWKMVLHALQAAEPYVHVQSVVSLT